VSALIVTVAASLSAVNLNHERRYKMNWGELKKIIEDAGVTDDMDIDYIDISSNQYPGPDVYIDKIDKNFLMY
jgi:hypothetical protein